MLSASFYCAVIPQIPQNCENRFCSSSWKFCQSRLFWPLSNEISLKDNWSNLYKMWHLFFLPVFTQTAKLFDSGVLCKKQRLSKIHRQYLNLIITLRRPWEIWKIVGNTAEMLIMITAFVHILIEKKFVYWKPTYAYRAHNLQFLTSSEFSHLV